MKIIVVGAGRAGGAMHRALKRAGATSTLRPLRRGIPKRGFQADLLILAVRDSALAPLAKRLARQRAVPKRCVVLHIAGGVDVEVLSPLRGDVAGVGSAHPLLSFASPDCDPSLRGALLLLRGDLAALKAGRRMARLLGARALDGSSVDPGVYHAAAALLANGAVALADHADVLLKRAGVPESLSASVLGALLGSVAKNIEIIGISGALTGPVVRGDSATVRRHIAALGQDGELLELYRLLAHRQLAIAARGTGRRTASEAELKRLLAPKEKTLRAETFAQRGTASTKRK